MKPWRSSYHENALLGIVISSITSGCMARARVFDKPTSWVLRSVRYTKSNRKTQTEMSATVDFDFWGNKQGVTVAHVLRAEIYGGQRKLKRHEIALQRIGILPPGHFIVPGDAAQMDAYGNMNPAQSVWGSFVSHPGTTSAFPPPLSPLHETP